MHAHVQLRQEFAQAGNQDLAAEDDGGCAHVDAGDGRVVREHEQRDADEQLVRDRIEHAPERRLLLPHAGEIAVEVIGDAGADVDGERPPASGRRRDHHEAEQHRRHGRNAGVSQHVRQAADGGSGR